MRDSVVPVKVGASNFLYLVTAGSGQTSGLPKKPLRKCGGMYREVELALLSLFSDDVSLKSNFMGVTFSCFIEPFIELVI